MKSTVTLLLAVSFFLFFASSSFGQPEQDCCNPCSHAWIKVHPPWDPEDPKSTLPECEAVVEVCGIAFPLVETCRQVPSGDGHTNCGCLGGDGRRCGVKSEAVLKVAVTCANMPDGYDYGCYFVPECFQSPNGQFCEYETFQYIHDDNGQLILCGNLGFTHCEAHDDPLSCW